jgi:hypothetical protein
MPIYRMALRFPGTPSSNLGASGFERISRLKFPFGSRTCATRLLYTLHLCLCDGDQSVWAEEWNEGSERVSHWLADQLDAGTFKVEAAFYQNMDRRLVFEQEVFRIQRVLRRSQVLRLIDFGCGSGGHHPHPEACG